MKTNVCLIIFVALSLFATGCLKTRAQLREETPDTPNQTMKGEVRNVEPAGSYAIDEIKNEITRLNGRIEDLERANQQQNQNLSNAQNEDIKKLQNRVQELESAQANMLEAIKKLETSAANAPTTTEATELYEKGRRQFQQADYNGAIDSFSGYLRNPNAKHLQDATFMRAESYFETKQYKKAIIDYSKFPEKFSKSKRMPTALLKIGQSFDAMGMKEDARGFYQELVDKFPRSPEAKKAKSKLK
jgi:tol-pal system protein YbgF